MKRPPAAMFLGILAACMSVSAAERGAAGKLILDESAYWRYYVRFGPDRIDPGALRAEGEKLLGQAGMKRLRTRVKRYLGPPYVTAAEAAKFNDADWRDHARVWFATGQGDNHRAAMNCHWPAPPADWAQPGGPASRWPRQRMPLMLGNALRPSNMHGDKDMQQLGVRAAYFRTTFDVLGAPGHASAWNPKRIADQAVFNLAPGRSDGGEYALLNPSGSPLVWKIASSESWLKAEPASGRLGPGARTFVKITAAPPDQTAARREAVLTVSKAGGATLTRKVIAHVIPPYRVPAAPAGEGVWLKDVPKTRIKSHKSVAYWCGTSARRRADYGPKFGPNLQVRPDGQSAGPNDMHAATEQVTVYDVAGAGFGAFSAKVRINPSYRRGTREGHHRVRVSFEVHADGRLLAQSGLMTAADDPRLIVATELAGVKEITFVTRFDRPNAGNLTRRVYCAWVEPKFHKGK